MDEGLVGGWHTGLNGSMYKCGSVASDVPHRSVLKVLLFNIFISDIYKGIESTQSKITVDTKLSGAIEKPQRQAAMQRDLDKLQK